MGLSFKSFFLLNAILVILFSNPLAAGVSKPLGNVSQENPRCPPISLVSIDCPDAVRTVHLLSLKQLRKLRFVTNLIQYA